MSDRRTTALIAMRMASKRRTRGARPASPRALRRSLSLFFSLSLCWGRRAIRLRSAECKPRGSRGEWVGLVGRDEGQTDPARGSRRQSRPTNHPFLPRLLLRVALRSPRAPTRRALRLPVSTTSPTPTLSLSPYPWCSLRVQLLFAIATLEALSLCPPLLLPSSPSSSEELAFPGPRSPTPNFYSPPTTTHPTCEAAAALLMEMSGLRKYCPMNEVRIDGCVRGGRQQEQSDRCGGRRHPSHPSWPCLVMASGSFRG